ncbi:hypothetical protein ACFVT2_16000 [Streptomyces sp. NPDC058000]|uniref:hypothetical protein n=1 Tax=Streptomyces sp. NPDC058000 TaxID=3346299 RepID=UPI0036E5FC4D
MAGPGDREVGRLSIRVLPDTSNFAVSLQRYLDRIERRARVQVQAVPDLDGFRERLNAKLVRVRARVRVNVDPDLSEFRSRLRERLQGANAGLGVRLEVSEREIARLRRELARIRPPMTIPDRVEADRDRLATLARDVSNVGHSSGGAGRKVLSLVGTLGKLSTAASSIPAVAGLSSSIASMGPAAAVAAPAVLALASAGVAPLPVRLARHGTPWRPRVPLRHPRRDSDRSPPGADETEAVPVGGRDVGRRAGMDGQHIR